MKLGYAHPDQGDDPKADPFRRADMAMARKIGGWLLTGEFKNHPFRAEVNHRQGIVKVYIAELMGPLNCYVLHIQAMKSENAFNSLMTQACGEILERYRIPRARYSGEDYIAALARAPIAGVIKDAPVPE